LTVTQTGRVPGDSIIRGTKERKSRKGNKTSLRRGRLKPESNLPACDPHDDVGRKKTVPRKGPAAKGDQRT